MLQAELRDGLVGGYVHGSAMLGGWHPVASDVDVLAVIAEPIDAAAQARLGARLAAAGTPPGSGLEMSVITAATAAELGDCQFEVHVTTGDDQKVVPGADHGGDPDLVLHVEVCRRAGYPVYGPPPAEVFGPVPRERVLAAITAELRWGAGNGSVAYAVLNACRAERYVVENVLSSKLAAGEWARARYPEEAVITEALTQQASGHHVRPATPEAIQFVAQVADRLESREPPSSSVS
ncbi:MAG TPA: aminoglycoside adenylyltransferase domain-containing protein [Natronosporangium sp.]